MGTDWAQVTKAWVVDGLIEDGQRAALQARLEALPPTSSGLPLGPLMTVLVAPASFLLIGSAVALMAALLDPPKVMYDLLIGGSAVVLVAAGGLGRFVDSVRPLARGLLASAVPLATWTAVSSVEEAGAPWLAPLAVVPAGLAWAGGWAENSRALTASASVMAVIASVYVLMETELFAWGPLVSLGCLGLLAVSTALRRLWPSRDVVLQVGAPALVFLGSLLLVTHEGLVAGWLRAAGVRDPWAVEKGLLVLGFGLASLLVGLVGRTGWVLVPGVVAMASATVWVAFTVGSFLGGAVALAVVSIGLFVGALLLWLLPWLRDARPAREGGEGQG